MGWYMGDFYAGARGDPGFWGFLGGIARSAVGSVPVVGPTIARISERIGARGGAIGAAATAGAGIIKATKGIIMKHPVLSAAGAAGTVAVAGAEAGHLLTGRGGAPRGFHPCKSKHGCKSGAFVRNRRMNVCNPRALRRSIRRTQGFAKLAMRTIHLVHPKKKARFGGFKKRRKR